MLVDDLGRFAGQGHDDHSHAALTQLCEATDQSMRSVLSRGKAASEWAGTLDVLDAWCKQIDKPVSRTDPFYPQLVRQFAGVELEAAGRILLRNQGEPAATPEPPLPVGACLSAMTEAYREYKKQHSGGKHTGTSVHVWSKLIAHLGDVPLSAVKASDLYDFLEVRMRAPVKPWSMQHAHGLVKRTLREVFALARTRGLLVGGNPVDDLEILPTLTQREERDRRKPRHPFSSGQLSTLFGSEWYRPDSTRWRGKMATDLAARYWVPLVCMLHGNRVREVLQLVASDIDEQKTTVPVIQFREEMEGEQVALRAAGVARSLKNDPTQRTVPLHPTLLALGFASFVQHRRQEDGENALLFPSCLPKPGGKAPILGRAYEQAFLRHVRDTLQFGHGFGSHSFRHQLEDRIRDAQRPGQQWPAGAAQAYTGRKRLRSQDVGYIATEGSESAYGRGHSPALLLKYVERLSFDGIELPPVYSTWLAQSERRGA
jgi:integrase